MRTGRAIVAALSGGPPLRIGSSAPDGIAEPERMKNPRSLGKGTLPGGSSACMPVPPSQQPYSLHLALSSAGGGYLTSASTHRQEQVTLTDL